MKCIVGNSRLPLWAESKCKKSQGPVKALVNVILLYLQQEMQINLKSQSDSKLGTGEGRYVF